MRSCKLRKKLRNPEMMKQSQPGRVQAWQTEPSQLGLACPAWYDPSRAEILKLGPKPSRSPARLVHCQAEQAWTGLGLLSLLSSGRCSTQINDSTRVKAILCATKFLD